MKSRRRVLIPISNGMSYRNILCTDLHRSICAAGLRPVYLVPSSVLEVLAADLPPGEADIDELPRLKQRLPETVLRDFANAIVQRRMPLRTMEILRERLRRGIPGIPIKQRLEPLVGSSWWTFTILDRLRSRFARAPEMQAPFDRWRPDLVFSNNVFSFEESAVLRRAGHLGVPTVGMVLSWDNPTNKGVPPSRPDRLLTWSEVTKREMVTLFRYPGERIRIVGSPQFDIYRRPIETNRAELLAQLGFPPEAKLLLYATGAPVHCPAEAAFPRALADLVSIEADPPVCLLVRLHPRDTMDRFGDLIGRPGIAVRRAGRASPESAEGWAPTPSDHRHFAALMRHVDVVVNLASTVALDAAANDRPVVHVRYEPEAGLHYLDSVESLYHYTHTARLMEYGASHVARSRDSLIRSVRRALGHPEELRDERRRMAQAEGVLGAGDSARRVAEILSRFPAD